MSKNDLEETGSAFIVRSRQRCGEESCAYRTAVCFVSPKGGALGFLTSLPDVGRRGKGTDWCGLKVISSQTSRMESDSLLQCLSPCLLSRLYFSSYKLLAHYTLPLHYPHTL